MKFIVLLIGLMFSFSAAADVPIADLPKTPRSFKKAKQILYGKIYKGHRQTFYCGCNYSKKRKVNLKSCGVTPRKNKDRALRVEAEHVMPASQFGNYRKCWREKICTNRKGKKHKGRSCCIRSDKVFKAAHNDLHNLFPSVGEINGDRLNYAWGMIAGEKRSYGACNIEVSSKYRRAEPPESVQGDIARVMLYMEKTYGFTLSKPKKKLYWAWSKADAPDAWEIERNNRIKKVQGNGNVFIEKYKATFFK